MARIVPATAESLRRMARLLQRGAVVAVPTETVYGLAADALEPRACRAIFRAKGRPLTDPLIVHVARPADAGALAEVNAAARILMRRFWPGPLTLVLRKRPCVPAIATAGLDTVALRCPAHAVMRRLIRWSGRPLAAPSANPFGYISPTSAEHVQYGLGSKIGYIVDGGPCRVGVESTIVDLSDPDRPEILRVGGVPAAAIRAALGRRVPVRTRSHQGEASAQRAPGMLTRHYSPRTPIALVARITARQLREAAPTQGFLFFRTPRFRLDRTAARVEILSPAGDPAEAARRLFARLHALDRAQLASIVAELAPARAAGEAVNDRLRRAAARRTGH